MDERERAAFRAREFLGVEFGEELQTTEGDRIAVRYDDVAEYENSWAVPFTAKRYSDRGTPPPSPVPGVVVVPKDPRVRPHFVPPEYRVTDYVDRLARGEISWRAAPEEYVTFFARVYDRYSKGKPQGVCRRRFTAARLVDECFTRDLEWRRTEYFARYRLGHNDTEHVRITRPDAEDLVRRIVKRLAPTGVIDSVGAARAALGVFLRRRFGPELVLPSLGPIVVTEHVGEYENAFTFVVQTVKYLETNDIRYGLMSGGVVVPKDGSAVHFAPTAIPVEQYLAKVAAGEQRWPVDEPEPVDTVTYYAEIPPGGSAENPARILRRRRDGAEPVDEVLTDDITWAPTDALRTHRVGVDHVAITTAELGEFIHRRRRR